MRIHPDESICSLRSTIARLFYLKNVPFSKTNCYEITATLQNGLLCILLLAHKPSFSTVNDEHRPLHRIQGSGFNLPDINGKMYSLASFSSAASWSSYLPVTIAPLPRHTKTAS